jgi:hypothetical protein
MSRTLAHRLAVLTLAATLLAAVPASASPGFGEWRGPGFADWIQESWSWLTVWWGGGEAKHGCGIDPDGAPCVPAPTAKLRCGIDPDGAPCVPEPTAAAKHGCGIDPNGAPCVPAPRATEKHGCDIDPDGKPCAPKP